MKEMTNRTPLTAVEFEDFCRKMEVGQLVYCYTDDKVYELRKDDDYYMILCNIYAIDGELFDTPNEPEEIADISYNYRNDLEYSTKFII